MNKLDEVPSSAAGAPAAFRFLLNPNGYSGTPSKKSTIPVSSEYSAPTTTNPSV